MINKLIKCLLGYFVVVFLFDVAETLGQGVGHSMKQGQTSDLDLKFVNESFIELYKKGKEAYLENNWSKCASLIERSLEIYRRIQQIQTFCRRKCKTKTLKISEVTNLDDQFLANTISKALCLLKCKDLYQEKHIDIASQEEMKDFHRRRPYNYIQNCYYKKDDIESAASAALTYFEVNSDDPMAKKTLDFYLLDPTLGLRDFSRVKSFEEKAHEDLFLRGVDAYEQKRDEQVVTYMELALKYFLEEEEECRTLCEGAFDQGWFPDFISSIANHYTYAIKCKQKCPVELSRIKGEMKEDFLPTIFNYLQFSYYKVGDLRKACEAVETFLVFKPHDSEMQDNKIFYRDQPGVRKDWFKPRQEAVDYVKRDRYEEAILQYIEEEFK